MKVLVTEVFVDKFTGEQYAPGTIINVDDESRVKDMEGRGLAKALEAKAETKPSKSTKSKKKE